MRSVGGAGFVIIGFLFLYLAITGKLDCFFQFVSCLFGTEPQGGLASTANSNSTGIAQGLVNGLAQGLSKSIPGFINFKAAGA